MGCCLNRDKENENGNGDSRSLLGISSYPEEVKNDTKMPESATPEPRSQFDTFANDKNLLLLEETPGQVKEVNILLNQGKTAYFTSTYKLEFHY
jgi:hypothetical protein